MFSGRVIISAINPDGQTFMGELGPGDVWFFPSSYIHSIQALEDGAEFLLIFDSGEFDENRTFLSAEALSRIPKSVIKYVKSPARTLLTDSTAKTSALRKTPRISTTFQHSSCTYSEEKCRSLHSRNRKNLSIILSV